MVCNVNCSRGSQHLPVWVASACRTMSHALWWQHNSNLVFWINLLTSTVIQSFKPCACAKIVKPILDGDSDYTVSLCTNTPKPDFWSGLNRFGWCEEHFTTNLLPQDLYSFVWSLMNHIRVDRSPSSIFHIVVLDGIRQNLLEYMAVLIPDSRGSQHLPTWAASACKTTPHPLRWHHNSGPEFWSHGFT